MTLNAKQQTELSDEHELFCKLYALSEDRNIRDNATAAYALSHPEVTRRSAGSMGSKLLKQLEIQERISQLRDEARLKQLRGIQQLEQEGLDLAKLFLNIAKMKGEYVYCAYRDARKIKTTEDGESKVYYDDKVLSERSAMLKCQVARASIDAQKAAFEIISQLHGLPEIEDFLIQSKERLIAMN